MSYEGASGPMEWPRLVAPAEFPCRSGCRSFFSLYLLFVRWDVCLSVCLCLAFSISLCLLFVCMYIGVSICLSQLLFLSITSLCMLVCLSTYVCLPFFVTFYFSLFVCMYVDRSSLSSISHHYYLYYYQHYCHGLATVLILVKAMSL